ncbi:hypothetical protein B1F69_04095 [Pseudomonas syringae]|uniref:ribbon-helix-helix protein, CopG family n=1 Tax=Pseudomonas syringae TaxID=317 RepID=UPI001012BFED|nr:hypothetical protein B1F69_04095 [Pseudomonas syringae]
MTSEPTCVVSFKLDVKNKRRFDSAMRANGTTMSEQLRDAVLAYLQEMDAGVEHPQFRLGLDDSSVDE